MGGIQRDFRAFEIKARRSSIALDNSIFRTGRQVVYADAVTGLGLDSDGGFAGHVVPAVISAEHHVIAGYYRVLFTLSRVDRGAGLVPDRNPYPPIGIMPRVLFLRRCGFGSLGVLHGDREGEDSVRGSVRAIHFLGQDQAGTAFVGGGKRGDLVIDVIGLAVDLVSLGGLVAFVIRRHRVLVVRQHEHGVHVVYLHGTHGGDIELPVIGDARFRILGLNEGEFMAGSQDLYVLALIAFLISNSGDAHDADGDVDLVLPIIIIIKRCGMNSFIICRNIEGDAGLLPGVQLVLPLLGYGEHFHGAGLTRRDLLFEFCAALAIMIRTGIRIAYGSGGVGVQGVVYDFTIFVFNFVQILFDVTAQFAILDVAVFKVGDQVQRVLAGVNVEGDGIGDLIQQDADAAEIPIHLAGRFREGCRRRGLVVKIIGPGPLVFEFTQFDGTGDGGNFGVAVFDRDSAVAVIGQSIGDVGSGIIMDLLTGESIFI